MNQLGVQPNPGLRLQSPYRSCHIMSYHHAMFPEDVPKGPWDDAPVFLGLCRAHHGVGLSCTSLAVGENGAVVAIHDALERQGGQCDTYPFNFRGPDGPWTILSNPDTPDAFAPDPFHIFWHLLTQWHSFLCAKCNWATLDLSKARARPHVRAPCSWGVMPSYLQWPKRLPVFLTPSKLMTTPVFHSFSTPWSMAHTFVLFVVCKWMRTELVTMA